MQVARAVRRYAAIRRRAFRHRPLRLPPGAYNPFTPGIFASPRFLLDLHRRHGPVFKTSWHRHMLICIVGNALAREFLRTHEDSLSGISQDLRPLFGEEDVRNLQGGAHRTCKMHLSKAISMGSIDGWEKEIRSFVAAQLDDYADRCRHGDAPGPELAQTLRTIATGMLVMLQFGVAPPSEIFCDLLAGYRKYGPDGLAWTIGTAQVEAHREIERIFDAAGAGRPVAGEPTGLLGRLAGEWADDALVKGNLVHMIEMGRHDVAALLKWIVSQLSDNPAAVRELIAAAPAGSDGSRRSAQAIVLETLRLVQSEALVRRVEKDIDFKGYLIPKGSYVRICLWEAHKDPDRFEDPFRFDPGRFLAESPDAEAYAPFGLGRHRCVAADAVVRLTGLFVEELVHRYSWTASGTGNPVLLDTLWEPPLDFTIDLARRT